MKYFLIFFLLIEFNCYAQQVNTSLYKTDKVKNIHYYDLNKNNRMDVYEDASANVDARVRDLMSQMNTDEKVEQLQCQIIQFIGKPRNYKKGFVRNVGARMKASESAHINNIDMLTCLEKTRLGIPVLNHEETLHSGGSLGATLLPISLAIAATWDDDLAYKSYYAISKEARSMNIRQHYSPCLYFCRDPRWGRMEETYGEDPFLVTKFGLSFVKAIRDVDAVPTLKGYPYNYGEGGRDSYPTYISERQFRELWFVPFEASVKKYGDIMSIMPAYSHINDLPAHSDPWLLTHILREEWGYKGIVTSDYGDHAKAMAYRSGMAVNEMEGARMTLEAGLDSNHPNGMEALPDAVSKGIVSEVLLDKSLARILRIKFLAGLFDNPFVDEAQADSIVHNKDHQDLALKLAQKAIVLLKNDKNVLPLKKIGTVGVFGPAAENFFPGGYGRGTIASDINPLNGLIQRFGDKVNFILHNDKSDPAILAKKCDVNLIFCTIVEGEGCDRSNLNLPVFKGDNKSKTVKDDFTIIANQDDRIFTEGNQEEIINTVAKTGVPTIVVLVTGSPVTMENWINNVSGVVQMWTDGEKGGLAIADVLFGDINPGGRLPVTFPKTIGQVPISYDYGPIGRNKKYWDDDGEPLFPFGFGLSYTTFSQTNLNVQSTATSEGKGEVRVFVDVTNTGTCAGDEVVQVYIKDKLATISTPNKQLKGFKRVTLSVGEKKTIEISIPAADLSLINQDMKRVIEPGEFTVMIGKDAENILLKGSFIVK
jgi:beta-glucosidase